MNLTQEQETRILKLVCEMRRDLADASKYLQQSTDLFVSRSFEVIRDPSFWEASSTQHAYSVLVYAYDAGKPHHENPENLYAETKRIVFQNADRRPSGDPDGFLEVIRERKVLEIFRQLQSILSK